MDFHCERVHRHSSCEHIRLSAAKPRRAKYTEHKTKFCAMGVFRSQTPRACKRSPLLAVIVPTATIFVPLMAHLFMCRIRHSLFLYLVGLLTALLISWVDLSYQLATSGWMIAPTSISDLGGLLITPFAAWVDLSYQLATSGWTIAPTRYPNQDFLQ